MTLRELIQAARRLGYRVESTRGGHLRMAHPAGAPVYAAATPGDRRSWRNTLADLRRGLRRRHARR